MVMVPDCYSFFAFFCGILSQSLQIVVLMTLMLQDYYLEQVLRRSVPVTYHEEH